MNSVDTVDHQHEFRKRLANRITIRKLASIFFILAAWTASFDIFLNIQIGINLRICQLFIILSLIFLFIIQKPFFSIKKFVSHPGFVSLWLWIVIIAAMASNAELIQRGAGYVMWAALSGIAVILPVQLFRMTAEIRWLARMYLYGFAFVAAFGLLQFVAGLAHLPAPLVKQWWIEGSIARVNGFSYEPSYFSTYLLLGYPIAAVLAKDRLLAPKWTSPFRLIRFLLFLAILLSSSRMGIAFMLMWDIFFAFVRLLKNPFPKSAAAFLRIIVVSCGLLTGAGFVVIKYSDQIDQLSFLLGGLGIAGEASHSIDGREGAFVETLAVFQQAPLTGVGLGSISEKIAQMNGVFPKSYEDTKLFEGQSVFAEVLAGTGVVGFTLFMIFYITLCFSVYRSAKTQTDPLIKQFMFGMVGSSLLVMGILQLNQNILRPYLWIHFGVMAAFASVQQYSQIRVRLRAQR